MSDIVKTILFFLVGSLTGWICVAAAISTRRYQRKKEINERASTVGTIVDMVKKLNTAPRARGKTAYYIPVVEFEANNHTYRLENENGYQQKEKIILGKSVEVMYDEENPSHFHLTEDDSNEKGAAGLLRLGLMIILGIGAIAVLNCFFPLF